MTDTTSQRSGRWKRYLAGGALVAPGFAAGGALANTMIASADTPTSSSSTTATSDPTSSPSASTSATDAETADDANDPAGAAGDTGRDESQPQRSDETLLTGTTADQVTAAALAKYPGATVQRVETDSDGVYEAHLVTTDGQDVIVQVGADFAVTGVQTR